MMCRSAIALLCLLLLVAALTACSGGKDYQVKVQVTGLAGSGLVLVNNGTDDLRISSNGTHAFRVDYPFAYPYKITVRAQPTGPDQLCSITNAEGRLTKSVDSVRVSCINAYRVSGTVTDLRGTGLQLLNNSVDRLSISASGAFIFSRLLADGSSYQVSILSQPGNQLCTVNNAAGVIDGANITDVQVICGTRAIGGTLTGLVGGGEVVLQNNGTDNLRLRDDGSFTFATTLYDGAGYDVTVSTQPFNQVCATSNGAGTVAGADVTDVQVACGFTVGGVISGPAGNQVVLQNNGGDDLVLGMNRSFSFVSALPVGAPYNVTLLTVPSGLSCTVVNGAGTMAAAAVSDVAVNCRLGPLLTAGYDIKRVVLNWQAVSGADFYRVLRSTDAGQSFSQISGDITQLSFTDPVDVHLTNWAVLNYKVQSCIGATCTDSNILSNLNSARPVGYVKAANAGAADRFGYALAVSGDGDTLAVGAPLEDSAALLIDGAEADDCADAVPVNCAEDSGAVYVLVRDPGTAGWTQQAYVKASNTGAGDNFGHAVALSQDGNTLIVGAPLEDANGSGEGDNSAADSGAAYVYTRSGATWSLQSYLKASNPEAGDNFGHAVALAGEGATLAVGAPLEDGNGSGEGDNSAADSGAVYVFAASGGGWSQQAYLKASNPEAGDNFGQAVSLSRDGDTLAAGAPLEDSAALLINGSQGDNSAADSGAAYVFTRTGVTWSQQVYVKSSNTDAGDHFGHALALAGDGATLAVTAPFEDSAALSIGGDAVDDCEGIVLINCEPDSGAAYIYARNGATWGAQAYVKASNTTAQDNFGQAVALSFAGDLLAVGAHLEDSQTTGVGGEQSDDGAIQSGAVYVYERAAGEWGNRAYAKASTSGVGDNFGFDLGLSDDGTTLVVGGPLEDSAATGISGNQADDCDATTPANCAADSGAAYIF